MSKIFSFQTVQFIQTVLIQTIHFSISIVSVYTQVSSVRQWLGRTGLSPRSRHTKNLKMVLDTSLVNTQHYKVRIKGKVEQSGGRSSALPLPKCSSYWKGSHDGSIYYNKYKSSPAILIQIDYKKTAKKTTFDSSKWHPWSQSLL